MSQFNFLHTTGKLISLDGRPLDSELLKGNVVLVVNVASRCGLTPQYTELVTLHHNYSPQGFCVLGVPCNQFGRQEPGTPDQIRQFCTLNFNVQFPLLEKQDVNGVQRSPLYTFLVGEGADIQWNFEKFLLSREGSVAHRFAPNITPLAPDLTSKIEGLL